VSTFRRSWWATLLSSRQIAGQLGYVRPEPQEAAVADPTTTEREVDTQLEQIRAQRAEVKNRHAKALSRLMTEREDLKGVHALADLVSDSLRWSA
jgi:energy-coupling factor transporter ATP-binding protein EcfA2